MNRKEYQREWARRKRAEKVEETMVEDLPWPYNDKKPRRWGEGVPAYIPPTSTERAAMGQIVEATMIHGEERSVDRDGNPLKCALPECGKVFKTRLPLMRFCSREHQMDRLRQLDTRG